MVLLSGGAAVQDDGTCAQRAQDGARVALDLPCPAWSDDGFGALGGGVRVMLIFFKEIV